MDKSNDIVLSPFAGIGSEGYVSRNGRRFIGIELKNLIISNLSQI